MQTKGLIVFLIGAAILAALSVFTVDQRQRAILLQFGKIVRADIPPGLHFKVPLVQDVLRFDARIITLDSDPQLYLTAEKKNVIVDSFVKWRIEDVRRFYTSTGGRISRTNDRLSEVITKQMRDEFGKRSIRQVVSGERQEIMDKLRIAAKEQSDELGITIVDVRIKRVDLPGDVSQAVFDRMSAERKKVANKFRSEGEEQARRIRAEADRDREVIVAEAEKQAQTVRGKGDATATAVYAKAFGQDTEFYTLYRSLNAYRGAFQDRSDVLVLDPSSKFFQYFKGIERPN